jgi:mannose-6-phosphate isomerase-like protein (cupin superfamily)
MSYSRRHLSLLIPALAAAALEAVALQAEDKILPAKAYKYEDLPVKVNGQNQGRAVFNGETHKGLPVELHMTKLGPGQAPHAPHHHVHEEVLMLKNGILDATFGGETTRLGPGSVIYMASNVEHGWKNPGTEPAEYFVIALGPNAG